VPHNRRMTGLGVALWLSAGPALAEPPTERFQGLCDASAGVALAGGAGFLMADDEKDAIYRVGPDRAVTKALDLETLLAVKKDAKEESDIEGAAHADGRDRVYWISSHSNNSKAVFQSSRLRLFATSGGGADGRGAITFQGRYYDGLRDDLAKAPKLASLKLAATFKGKPEEKDGFSIEGLATTPGGSLLVGFRNPVPNGQALIVEIKNPAQLVDRAPGDTTTRAVIGDVFRLDLKQGRGVRSLERVAGGYVIVAGPFGGKGEFTVFDWAGPGAKTVKARPWKLKGLHPESIFAVPGGLRVLSDLGDEKADGETKCKDRKKDDPDKFFTSVVFPAA